jgi:hypothetical protein
MPNPSSGAQTVPKFSAPLTSSPCTVPPSPLAGKLIWPIGLMVTSDGIDEAVEGKGIPLKSKVPFWT